MVMRGAADLLASKDGQKGRSSGFSVGAQTGTYTYCRHLLELDEIAIIILILPHYESVGAASALRSSQPYIYVLTWSRRGKIASKLLHA